MAILCHFGPESIAGQNVVKIQYIQIVRKHQGVGASSQVHRRASLLGGRQSRNARKCLKT